MKFNFAVLIGMSDYEFLKKFITLLEKNVLKKRSFKDLFENILDPPYDFLFEDEVWSGFYEIFTQIKLSKRYQRF